MAVIRHFEADPEEREAYLKQRRLMAGATEDEADEAEGEEEPLPPASSPPNAMPKCRRPRI